MGRTAREVLPTPPGYKRCSHCSKSSNSFIDVREKHKECETCREKRKKAAEDKEAAAHDMQEGTSTRPRRSMGKTGKKTKRKPRVFDGESATSYDNKKEAFDALKELAENEDSFRFHGRYVADDPPGLNEEDEEGSRSVAADYVHRLNADITDTTEWRFVSRGKKSSSKSKAITINYCCSQDSKSKKSRPMKDPEKNRTGAKPMDRYECNGRLTIVYEPEHQVVEIRLTHEAQHPAYKGRAAAADRSAPMPIAAAGEGGGLMHDIVDAPMLSAQEASMLYAEVSAPMPVVSIDPRAYDVPVTLDDDDDEPEIIRPSRPRSQRHSTDVPVFADSYL